jgi:hypothetical protein
MDWFERLTGFREESYEATRAKLSVEGGRLHSLVNGKSYGVGESRRVRARGLSLSGLLRSLAQATAFACAATSTSDALRPSSSNAKGSRARESQTVACSINCRRRESRYR